MGGVSGDAHALHAGGPGQECYGRGEIDVAVGDVKGKDSVGGEVATIESESLGGEQVDGDGVAGKGVDDQDIKALGLFAGQRGTGIAFHDVDCGGGVTDIAEDVSGNGGDSGVDVVETDQ